MIANPDQRRNPTSLPPELDMIGRIRASKLYRNLSTPRLIEEALKRSEGWLSKDGVFIAQTGIHTGRSAKDKFVVLEPNTSADIWWHSPYQKPLSEQHFQTLLEDLLEHFQARDTFVLDAFAGADSGD